MAQRTQEMQQGYPLPVYEYRLSLLKGPIPLPGMAGKQPEGLLGADAIGFKEVSGLKQEYEPVVYYDGLSFASGANIQLGRAKEMSITLRRGILPKSSELFNWLLATHFLSMQKKTLLVDLCDQAGVPSVRWTVRDAMPVKVSAPDFNAEANEVAIETVELIATDMFVEYF